MFRKLFLIAVCVTLWPVITFAANDVPTKIGAFLAYCKTNSEGCLNEISNVSFGMLLTNTGAKKEWCPTEEIDDVKALMPKVVQWLAAHPENNNKNTDDGIKTAFYRLYPCGRSDAAPKATETAADFLTFCQVKANQSKCMDDIVDVNLAFVLNDKFATANNYCEPKGFDAVDSAPSVLNWLGTHAELRAAPKNTAIAKAWGALYPCRKN